MRKIYTLSVVAITALIGAVILGSSFANTPAYGGSILPIAEDAEAHVPVPEPIPTVPTVERQDDGRDIDESRNLARPSAGRPVRIVIADASVDAKVMDVGVTPDGNLDVPPNFTDVGWYKYGTLPGDNGSAVLDGHVDNGGSIDGVFKHLRRLEIGDEISIITENGDTLRFKVTRSDVYHKDRFPGEQVFHEKGSKLIKLITCHGTYLPEEDTYDLRLVVTAELVE